MEEKCKECGMVGFHKLSCSVPFKTQADLKDNWYKLKEYAYYRYTA